MYTTTRRPPLRITLVVLLCLACGAPMALAAMADGQALKQSLSRLESPAEDLLDAIAARDAAKMSRLYQELETGMARLNRLNTSSGMADAQSRKIGLQNSWFDLISLEMREMDDLPALAYDVNQFSGQLIISTGFRHEYEKNIAWMDYLGRELLLLGKQPSDTALVKIRKADLHKTWTSIRALMVGKKAAGSLIRDVDSVVHAIMTESAREKLMALSQQELELVDKLEEFFHIG